MRVLIDQELFGRPEALSLAFLEVFALAREGRHTLLTRPVFADDKDSPVGVWLSKLPGPIAKQVLLVLEQALQSAAGLSADLATIAIAETDDWCRGRLTLPHALRLMRMPLGLLLEHRRTDLRFLLALAPPTQRQQLKEALDAGWIEVLNGGGLPDMTALIRENLDQSSATIVQNARVLRLWVMFDRDSDPADRARPSPNSERLRHLCQQASADAGWAWSLNHYQLGRRTIENYLPERLLRLWQEDVSGRNRTKRRQTIDALCELRKSRPKAGRQYNMKEGLVGDLESALKREVRKQDRDVRDEELDPLFQGISDQVRKALRDGFSSKIADLFDRDPDSYEDAFRAEFEFNRGAHEPTREAILNSLFARL